MLQVHRLVNHAADAFIRSQPDVHVAINMAAGQESYTQSYGLTRCLMLLLVERAQQLQAIKQPAIVRMLSTPAAAHLGSQAAAQQLQEQLARTQQQLLQQAEAAGEAAKALFAVQKQRLLAKAGGDEQEQQQVLSMRNAALEEVQALLHKLPAIAAELSQQANATELVAVLAAVMRAEGGHSSLENFMAGHLYECPNGHLFVIGNCGGAMQVRWGGGGRQPVVGNAAFMLGWLPKRCAPCLQLQPPDNLPKASPLHAAVPRAGEPLQPVRRTHRRPLPPA